MQLCEDDDITRAMLAESSQRVALRPQEVSGFGVGTWWELFQDLTAPDFRSSFRLSVYRLGRSYMPVVDFLPAHLSAEFATPLSNDEFWHGPPAPPAKRMRPKRQDAGAEDDELEVGDGPAPIADVEGSDLEHIGLDGGGPEEALEEEEDDDDVLGLLEAAALGMVDHDGIDDEDDDNDVALPPGVDLFSSSSDEGGDDGGGEPPPEEDHPDPPVPAPEAGPVAAAPPPPPEPPPLPPPLDPPAPGPEPKAKAKAKAHGKNELRYDWEFGYLVKNENSGSIDAHCKVCKLKVNRKFIEHHQPTTDHRLAQGRPMGVLLALLFEQPCPGHEGDHRRKLETFTHNIRLRHRKDAIENNDCSELFKLERKEKVGVDSEGEPMRQP